MCPPTCPLLQGSETAFRTAARSASSVRAKRWIPRRPQRRAWSIHGMSRAGSRRRRTARNCIAILLHPDEVVRGRFQNGDLDRLAPGQDASGFDAESGGDDRRDQMPGRRIDRLGYRGRKLLSSARGIRAGPIAMLPQGEEAIEGRSGAGVSHGVDFAEQRLAMPHAVGPSCRVSRCTKWGLAQQMWWQKDGGGAAAAWPYILHETQCRLVAQFRDPRPLRRPTGWSMAGFG